MYKIELSQKENWYEKTMQLVREGGADPNVYDVTSNACRFQRMGLSSHEAAKRLINIYFV